MLHVSARYVPQRAEPPLDRAIAALARRQHGVAALDQLRAIGLGTGAVEKRVAAGRLHRIHRGVYAVGHPLLSADGRALAAVLACGPSAALSHRSAAAQLALLPSGRRTIDVTSPGRARRARGELRTHGGVLDPRDVAVVDCIPCTKVPRTLLDIAEVVDRRTLERACEKAEMLRVFDLRAIAEILARANGRRGAPILRALLLEQTLGETYTRRELEELFLAICRAAGIPHPAVNEWILDGAYQADFLWRRERLIAETDGFATHGTRRAFEHDRERDRRLLLAGYRVVRFTWRQVTREPEMVAATLRSLLSQGGESVRTPA